MVDQNQHDKAIKDLTAFQILLGDMGFAILGDGTYYKDYGLMDGSTLRLVPHFNKGISIDKAFELSAISMNSVKTIPIVGGGATQLNEFPKECMEDVTKMMVTMAPQSRMVLTESYIITNECCECHKVVSSFFNNKGQITCLDCI